MNISGLWRQNWREETNRRAQCHKSCKIFVYDPVNTAEEILRWHLPTSLYALLLPRLAPARVQVRTHKCDINRDCCRLSSQEMHLRLTHIYTCLLNYPFPQNISILVVLLYSWQISVNMKKYQSLGDVYYGEHPHSEFPKLIWWYLLNFFCSAWCLMLSRRKHRKPNRCLGVQIAYYAIIFSQFSMMVLSVLLAIGVYTVSHSLCCVPHARLIVRHL